MAPSNDYLNDAAKRGAIIAHDPQMIVKTGRAYGDGEFEIHWDLNRSKEVKVIVAALLESPTGHTQDSFCATLWGYADDYLRRRVLGHFNPVSSVNLAKDEEGHRVFNGEVFLVNEHGEIESKNRRAEALRLAQGDADFYQETLTRKHEREDKKLGRRFKERSKLAGPENLAEVAMVMSGAVQRIARLAEAAADQYAQYEYDAEDDGDATAAQQ